MRPVSPHLVGALMAARAAGGRRAGIAARRSQHKPRRRTMRRQVRTITLTYRVELPQPVPEVFEFVADPASWPLFFDRVEHAEPRSGWGRVGGRGTMTTRFLGRRVASDLELTEWHAPDTFRYVARHKSRPELHNRREFEPTAAGTLLRGSTTIVLRGRLHEPIDRLSAWVLQRMYDRAMSRLGEIAAAGSLPVRRSAAVLDDTVVRYGGLA